MPNQTFEPGLWSFILAAVTGAAGWIWRGGSERAKTEAALRDLAALFPPPICPTPIPNLE